MATLKEKSIHAVKWNSIGQASRLVLKFGLLVLLARLLEPRDFGLVAMVYAIADISSIFLDSGFNSALIQKKDLTSEDCSSVFYLNLAVGLVLTLLFWAIAPLLASFYGEPLVEHLAVAISVVFVIGALGLVQRARLTRDIAFKKLALVNLSATMLGGAAGVFCALNGFGVWSLVVVRLMGQIIATTLLWVLSPWRPGFVFQVAALKGLLRFSSSVLAGRVVSNLSKRLDEILVARMFPVSELGFYSKARRNVELPKRFIAQVGSRSFFPLLSKLQDDRNRFRDVYSRVLNLIAFISFPLFAFLIVTAEELILVVFGEKWLDSTYYFQLFCLIGAVATTTVMKEKAINALGHPERNLKVSVFVSPARLIALLLVAVFFGDPSVFIWTNFGFAVLVSSCRTYILKELIGIGYLKELSLIAKELSISVLAATTCAVAAGTWDLPSVYVISLNFGIFILICIGLAYLLRLPGMNLITELATGKLSRYSNKGVRKLAAM